MIDTTLWILFVLCIHPTQGYYNTCTEASYQGVIRSAQPVHCQSICYERGFAYYDIVGPFCFCSNSTACDFKSVSSNYPVSLLLEASNGIISEPITIKADAQLADASYEGDVTIYIDGQSFTVSTVNGHASHSITKVYLEPGVHQIRGNVTSGGLTISDTLSVTLTCGLNIVPSLVLSEIGESGKLQMVSSRMIIGYEVQVKVSIDNTLKYTFSVMEPEIETAGELISSPTLTTPNTLYKALPGLPAGYMYGVTVSANSGGHITLQVVCYDKDDENYTLNSTQLALATGLNSILLTPVHINTTSCHMVVTTGLTSQLFIRNPVQMLAGYDVGELSIKAYLSKSQQILVPVMWTKVGIHTVSFTFSSQGEEITRKGSIEVLDRVEGLCVQVTSDGEESRDKISEQYCAGGDRHVVQLLVFHDTQFNATFDKGTDVVLNWSKDPATINPNITRINEVSITADNKLNLPQTVLLTINITDQKVEKLHLRVSAEVSLLTNTTLFVLSGEKVNFNVFINEGTGLEVKMDYGDGFNRVLSTSLNNKNRNSDTLISYTYSDTHSDISPSVCLRNSLQRICSFLDTNISVIRAVDSPSIDIDDYIRRGNVVTVSSNVQADGYIWTKDTPDLNIQLTDTGIEMREEGGEVVGVSEDPNRSFYLDKIGPVVLRLYVFNKLSWKHTEKTVFVEHQVQPIGFRIIPDVALTNSDITLTLFCSPTYTYHVMFNSSVINKVFPCEKLDIIFKFRYSTVGRKDILLTTYNNISSEVQRYQVIVQNVVDINFYIFSTRHFLAVNETVLFSALARSPTVIPVDLFYVWYVNGTKLTSGDLAPLTDVTNITNSGVTFSNLGTSIIRCCLNNRISNRCNETTVEVLIPVSGLMVTYSNTAYVISPGQVINIRCSVVSGSSVKFTADLGNEKITFQNGQKQGIFKHEFQEAGVYPITISATNAISKLSKHLPSYIYVQNIVRDVKLLSFSPVKQELGKSTMKTGEVYLELEIGHGTNCTIRCDFGDDTPVVTVEGFLTAYNVPVIDELYTVQCKHSYTKPGVFSPTIRVFNSVSFIDIPGSDIPEYVVEVPISGVEIQIPDTIVLGQRIDIQFTAESGTNIVALWYVNGAYYRQNTFTPTKEGKYEFSAVLTNNLSTVTVTKDVNIETRLKYISFDPQLSPVAKLSDKVNFKIQLAPSAVYNVNYLTTTGDGTRYALSDISHSYRDIGTYDITISATNSINSVKLTHTFQIQDEILRVMIKGNFVVVPRQQSIFVAEVYKKNTLNVADFVHYQWSLDGVIQEQDSRELSVLLDQVGTHNLSLTVYNDVSSHSVTEQVEVSDNILCLPPDVVLSGADDLTVRKTATVILEATFQTHCRQKHRVSWQVLSLDRTVVMKKSDATLKTLSFSASQFSSGTYIIRLEVFVVENPTIYSSDEISLLIEDEYIIPKLNYPTFTTISTKDTLLISLNESIILDNSLDISSFRFSWACRFEPQIDGNDPCMKLALSNNTTPRVLVNFAVSGFGNLSVIIWLNEKQVEEAYLVFNVTNYVLPLVTISVKDRHLITPNNRIVISMECTQRNISCFNPTIYWDVQRLSHQDCQDGSIDKEDTGSFVLSAGMTTTGLNQSHLVFKPGVFTRGGSYKVQGCVWKGVCGGEILNFPCGPIGGSCSAKIRSSDNMIELSCSGWRSGSGQLTYEVSYHTLAYPIVLYIGPRQSSRFILPPGEHVINVYVVDQTGVKSSTQGIFMNVSQSVYNETDIKDLLNSNNYQLALQQISAQAESDAGELDYEDWISDVREVLVAMNNTKDMALYLSSVSTTLIKLLYTQTKQDSMTLFIEYLELVIRFLNQILQEEQPLPDNTLEIILEILNKLLNLPNQMVKSKKRDTTSAEYLSLLNEAYLLCDEITALILTIKLNERVTGEEDVIQKQEAVGVLGRKISSTLDETFETSGYSFKLPKSLETDEHETCLQGHMVLYDENPYGNLAPVSSRVSSLSIRYCNGTEKEINNTERDITITLPINENQDTTETLYSILTHKRTDNSTRAQYKVELRANIHSIFLPNEILSPLIIEVSCMDTMTGTNVPLKVLIAIDNIPTNADSLMSGLISEGSMQSFYLDKELLEAHSGKELMISVTNNEDPSLPYDVQTPPDMRKYRIQYWFSQCLFRDNLTWQDRGCVPSSESRPTKSVCQCSHLTLFATKHTITPNKLDIGFLISTRDIKDGHVVMVFLCSLLLIYIATLTVFVKLDIAKGANSSVIYLMDNYERDKQSYLVRIVTGSQPNAGTTAKVNIRLFGRQRESHARLLTAQRHLFSSKSRESFVLKFPTSLGKLHHVHIWHDNSGKDPSWFLESVTIVDLSNNKTRYFPCHEWLAVEEGSGEVEKMLQSSKSPYKNRWAAFISNASFSEHHIWASLLKDHTYAHFSRPQRLTVCFTLIFLLMAVNVAFWTPAQDTTFDFTIFHVGSEEFIKGLISSLIIFPFTLSIIILFRRSQTRLPLVVHRDSTEHAANKCLSEPSIEDVHSPLPGSNIAGLRKRKGLTPVIEDSIPDPSLQENPVSVYWCDGGVSLPWWCSVVGWMFCSLIIICSVVLTTLYGIQFGNNKSLQWLASFAVSFLESVLISQPFIVIGCGLYAWLMFGKKKKKRPISKAETITLTHMLPRNLTTKAYEGLARLKAFRFQSSKPPPHKATMMASREECLKRKQLSTLWNSVCLHFYLLIVVLLAAHTTRPDLGHWNVYGIRTTFNGKGPESVYNISNSDGWFHWMGDTLLPNAFWEPHNYDMRGYTRDGGFYILGSARLRMKLKTQCPNGGCIGHWSSSLVPSFYSNKTGYPSAGVMSWYDESGYIVYLTSSKSRNQDILNKLKRTEWINKATSAVFVEMSLYNPPTNTFVDVKYLTEFPDFCLPQSSVKISPLHVLHRVALHESIIFMVLAAYVVGLILLLREIFNLYTSNGSSSPCLTYNTILAIFMVASFAIHLTRIAEVNHIRHEIISKSRYLDLNTISFLTTIMNMCYGMSSFLLIMRSILCFKFFRVINIFQTVLYVSLVNMLHFSIFLVITIVVFSLTGMILFGAHVLEFSSFTNAIMSLLGVLTRNMKYLQFQKVQPYIAPAYFMLFYGVIYLILFKIVVAIFIRTMFELRRGQADSYQLELARFVWDKFQLWLWADDEESDTKKKSPNTAEVVSTKVDEVEAFVDALLRTVEAVGTNNNRSRPNTVSNARSVKSPMSSNSNSVRTSSSGSSSRTYKDPTEDIYHDQTTVLSSYGPLDNDVNPSAHKLTGRPTDKQLSKQTAKQSSEQTATQFSKPSARQSSPKLPGQTIQVSNPGPNNPIPGETRPIPFNPIKPISERPKTLKQNARKHRRLKVDNSVSLKEDLSIEDSTSPVVPCRDEPSIAEFIPSPTDLPTYIPEIKNKKAVLPPLRTPSSLTDDTQPPTKVRARRYRPSSLSERPIIGGNALTPVEKSQQISADNVQGDEGTLAELSEVSAGVDTKSNSDTACTPEEDAFNQLRAHLQRGDTCPDVIIKSILTEIDRPQTTPGDIQKQTALIAEHLMRAGWDDQPLQREQTELSLFSLLTRESTQLSDWQSLSRESTLEGSRRPTTVTRPNAARPKFQFRNPSSACGSEEDEQFKSSETISENVTALVKRALLQVTSRTESVEAFQGSEPTSEHTSPETGPPDPIVISEHTSPETGPPDPIVTENTFIFARGARGNY